jgi:3-methylcrotonyl-CoA carboxylase alpha subunit
MFRKIIVANRGEIACRVMRTARRMGVETVAVYSEPDTNALHVRMADEAHCIGGAPSADSYLRGDRVLDVARRTGAQAIHPGYGFLSENADFADAAVAAGVTFIGPPGSSMRSMGSKDAAKRLMEAAGVPLLPGYHGADQSMATLAAEADRCGLAAGSPVLFKAVLGGGGKGMRIVRKQSELAAAVASAQREALASFGDARLLVERYLDAARHIEVQASGSDEKGSDEKGSDEKGSDEMGSTRAQGIEAAPPLPNSGRFTQTETTTTTPGVSSRAPLRSHAARHPHPEMHGLALLLQLETIL